MMKKIVVLISLITVLFFSGVQLDSTNQVAVDDPIISKETKQVAVDDPINPKAYKNNRNYWWL